MATVRVLSGCVLGCDEPWCVYRRSHCATLYGALPQLVASTDHDNPRNLAGH